MGYQSSGLPTNHLLLYWNSGLSPSYQLLPVKLPANGPGRQRLKCLSSCHTHTGDLYEVPIFQLWPCLSLVVVKI